jgi:hypothetical protein
MSVIPPKAAVNADILVRPVRAITGCEQSQQTLLLDHLVGKRDQRRGKFDERDHAAEHVRVLPWRSLAAKENTMIEKLNSASAGLSGM